MSDQTFRSIDKILPSTPVRLGEAIILQPLPTSDIKQISPFLLLHHFGPKTVAAGIPPIDVGPHPHRGFEPVTFLFEGGVEHRDSRGNHGILKSGDVQWMTAGRGIVHSERTSKAFLETGGTFQLIQLWINLPKKDKMTQPRYQDIKAEEMPVVRPAEGVEVKIVAGEFEDKKGPADTFTPIFAFEVKLDKHAEINIPVPDTFNALSYVLEGQLGENDGQEVYSGNLIRYEKDGGAVKLKADYPSRILFLAGEPIDEPMVSWGPYVMNTQTEILEAMRDYQMGKMGIMTY